LERVHRRQPEQLRELVERALRFVEQRGIGEVGGLGIALALTATAWSPVRTHRSLPRVMPE
jgi:hypothetical protein